MKVDLEELRQQIESEFKRIEQQEGELQKQLQHLAVVQGLVEASPAERSG